MVEGDDDGDGGGGGGGGVCAGCCARGIDGGFSTLFPRCFACGLAAV